MVRQNKERFHCAQFVLVQSKSVPSKTHYCYLNLFLTCAVLFKVVVVVVVVLLDPVGCLSRSYFNRLPMNTRQVLAFNSTYRTEMVRVLLKTFVCALLMIRLGSFTSVATIVLTL